MERVIENLPGRERSPKRLKVAAYLHAEGGNLPRELALAQYIERYGAASILGRPLSAKELVTITTMENIVYAYRSEQKALNWAVWAGEHPNLAKILREVRALIKD